jgi:hypothetical protein
MGTEIYYDDDVLVLFECPVCHLDTEILIKGVCLDCHENYENQDRYNTEFIRTHGIEYDYEDGC